jgi:hydrogenase maturation protease
LRDWVPTGCALLLSDEGAGLHVVKRLAEDYDFPEHVQILDGGTLGLDLLCYLEGVENLLIVDAVENGAEPGTLLRLEGDAVPSFLSAKMSPHQIGVSDLLFAAKLSGLYPRNVVLLGIQPGTLDIGLELSPAVAGQVGALLSQVVEQLAQWGHHPRPACLPRLQTSASCPRTGNAMSGHSVPLLAPRHLVLPRLMWEILRRGGSAGHMSTTARAKIESVAQGKQTPVVSVKANDETGWRASCHLHGFKLQHAQLVRFRARAQSQNLDPDDTAVLVKV